MAEADMLLTEFDGRSSFATWLTRITIDSALVVLRKKRASPLVPIEGASSGTRLRRLKNFLTQAQALKRSTHSRNRGDFLLRR